ncbi:MAG: hypothetical protein HKN94_09150 [Acidimicrobiales bacterium]|nr:hypothetical protein [Acidimicrobiales bacterium]
MLLVVAANLILIWLFFDKAWIPSDDGHYVHVAERISQGEVLNADVEELHPGYVHFIHAWSLEIFGDRIVSLRYPLMALMAIQSLLTHAIFRQAGVLVATVAAITMSAIGTFQIANPTTGLYALGATVAITYLLQRTSPESRHRALSIGALLGLVFLFRQLTAVFVAMGVLTFLMVERRPEPQRSVSSSGPRLVLAASLVGLVGYLLTSTDLTAALLFGCYPILILIWAFSHTTIGTRDLGILLSRLAFGAAGSALPLVGYHVFHGSVRAWARDTFVRSLSIGELEHISTGRYVWDIGLRSINELLFGSIIARLNAVYWIALLVVAFAIGRSLYGRLRHRSQWGVPTEYALPFVAVFYALVSVFNQIPFYLYLSAGLSIVAGLWLFVGVESISEGVGVTKRSTRSVVGVALALSVVAATFHAGQPYTRTYSDLVSGQRVDLIRSELPRLGLWIDPQEEALYSELLQLIDSNTQANDVLFTVPNNADLYFLARRANGFRLFNPTISILDDSELRDFVAEFESVNPAMIVHDTRSAYNTDMTAELIDRITIDFGIVMTIDHFELYVREP